MVSPGAGLGYVPVVHDVQVPNSLEETEPGDGNTRKSRQNLGSVQFDSHDVVLDLDEELLHGEDVVGDVERADGDEERRVVQADQLAQHLATDVALGGVQSYILIVLCLSHYS